MNSTTRNICIALIVLALAAACLLWIGTHQKVMSYRVSAIPTAATSSTVVVTNELATSTTQPASKYGFAAADGITFEIATSSAKQQQGLGNRAVIPDNYAMLFVFSHDDTYGFWMKDMLAPLDMIWLSDNGTIVSITQDALPSSYPNVFYPPVPIRYVLETRPGLAAEKNWHIGTHVPLPLPYGK